MNTEIKETNSSLTELTKGYEKLSDNELNKSIDLYGILPNKEEGLKIESDDSSLAELAKGYEKLSDNELNKSIDLYRILPNKEEGLRREAEVLDNLNKIYREEDGYKIISEAYLRDSEGKIIRDPVTNEARRIDYIIVKDGKVVDSIEVTSETADKTGQIAKENRIREAGGNYIKTADGSLVKIPDNVHTRIERRK